MTQQGHWYSSSSLLVTGAKNVDFLVLKRVTMSLYELAYGHLQLCSLQKKAVNSGFKRLINITQIEFKQRFFFREKGIPINYSYEYNTYLAFQNHQNGHTILVTVVRSQKKKKKSKHALNKCTLFLLIMLAANKYSGVFSCSLSYTAENGRGQSHYSSIKHPSEVSTMVVLLHCYHTRVLCARLPQ